MTPGVLASVMGVQPLLTLALLTFIGSWNDYLWPLLVGRNEDVRVLTVALAIFREQRPQVLGAPGGRVPAAHATTLCAAGRA